MATIGNVFSKTLSVCLTNVIWSKSVTSEFYARKLATELFIIKSYIYIYIYFFFFPIQAAQT